MRVSDQQLVALTEYGMNAAYHNMAQAQTVLATGHQINTPADNPIGTATALSLQANLAQTAGYSGAIDNATGWLQTTEGALSSVNDALTQVRTLAVQGSNDTLSASERQSLAAQVGQIVAGAVNAANATFGGRYVLSGFQTSTAPFSLTPGTSVTYHGDAGVISPELAAGQSVQTNLPGSTALPAVFSAMLAVQNDLQANNGTAVGADLGTVDSAQNGLLMAQATVGATTSRVQQLGASADSLQTDLKTRISGLVDADLAQASVEFSTRQAAYQAALAAAAKVVMPSLLDYLK